MTESIRGQSSVASAAECDFTEQGSRGRLTAAHLATDLIKHLWVEAYDLILAKLRGQVAFGIPSGPTPNASIVQ